MTLAMREAIPTKISSSHVADGTGGAMFSRALGSHVTNYNGMPLSRAPAPRRLNIFDVPDKQGKDTAPFAITCHWRDLADGGLLRRCGANIRTKVFFHMLDHELSRFKISTVDSHQTIRQAIAVSDDYRVPWFGR